MLDNKELLSSALHLMLPRISNWQPSDCKACSLLYGRLLFFFTLWFKTAELCCFSFQQTPFCLLFSPEVNILLVCLLYVFQGLNVQCWECFVLLGVKPTVLYFWVAVWRCVFSLEKCCVLKDQVYLGFVVTVPSGVRSNSSLQKCKSYNNWPIRPLKFRSHWPRFESIIHLGSLSVCVKPHSVGTDVGMCFVLPKALKERVELVRFHHRGLLK